MQKCLFFFTIVITIVCNNSCQNKKRIYNLLQSDNKDDIIRGAYLAGESEDSTYVPLLLKNAWDARMSTSLSFKGFTVYQEKMFALKRICKREPPVPITYLPDSAVILFYSKLFQENK